MATTTITKTEKLVGKRIRRREDPRLITGTATYVDDIKMPGMYYASILRSPYAAAKWGVVGFTKSLAVEAGPDKVRVNCILPGIVEGERIERVIAAKAKAHGVSHDEFRRRFLETTSLHSTVSAEDIANMVLFLCSPAGARITGQPISVDADVRYLV